MWRQGWCWRKSSIEIKNLIGSQNYLDFAVKDGSILYLNKFDTDKDLDYKCGSIYKKNKNLMEEKYFIVILISV